MQILYRRSTLLILVVAAAVGVISCAAATRFLSSNAPCPPEFGSDSNACWSAHVEALVQLHGVEAALREIAVEDSASFKAVCHGLMHEMGANIYDAIENGVSIHFSPNMDGCTFGIYHGFMIAAAREDSLEKSVRRFCTGSATSSSFEDNIPQGECYHGIGNAIAYQHEDLWNDPSRFVPAAERTCTGVTHDASSYHRCMGGVYNTIGNAHLAGDISYDPHNPYAFCTYDMRTARLCYLNVSMLFIRGADSLEGALLPIFDHNLSPEDLRGAVQAVAKRWTVRNSNIASPAYTMHACSKLRSDMQGECIDGSVQGLMHTLMPSSFIDRTTRFCSDPAFPTEAAVHCFYGIPQQLGKYVEVNTALCDHVTGLSSVSCREALASVHGRNPYAPLTDPNLPSIDTILD